MKKVRRLRKLTEEKQTKSKTSFESKFKDYEPFTVRQLRVAELIKTAIQETIAEETFDHYPNVKSNLSIENIEVTRDLRFGFSNLKLLLNSL